MPDISRNVKRRLKKTAKFILQRFISLAYGLFPVTYEAYKVRKGYRIYRKIKETYGEDCFIFFFRGATGDVFLANSLLSNFIQQKQIKKYVYLGDGKGLHAISILFGVSNAERLSRWSASCFQSFYRFDGQKRSDIYDLFLWQHTMYFNRCRTRMLERFNFMDTYQWYVFGFDRKKEITLPRFCENTTQNQEKWAKMGIVPGRTVIISPHAYSVTELTEAIWKRIDSALTQMGWKTLYCIDSKKEYPPFEEASTIWFSFRDSVPILEYAGAFLGVRSGLCDIVSSADCRMVILYPCALKTPNYSEHRSDRAFCGLRAMGLNEYAIEIDTPLIRNIEIREDIYCNDYGEEDIDGLIREIQQAFM